MWILKLDSDGNISWQKTYGGGDYDYASSIQQTTDGGYIVAGILLTLEPVLEICWILKLDQVGNVILAENIRGSDQDYCQSIQQTRDGGYIVAGYTVSFGAGNEDMWILKLDSNGEINNADFIGTSNAIVTDTSISGVTSAAIVSSPSPTVEDTTAIPQDTSADEETQGFAPDWFPIEPPHRMSLNGVWGYLSSDPDHRILRRWGRRQNTLL